MLTPLVAVAAAATLSNSSATLAGCIDGTGAANVSCFGYDATGRNQTKWLQLALDSGARMSVLFASAATGRLGLD